MVQPSPDQLATGIDADRITPFTQLTPVWQHRLSAALAEPEGIQGMCKVSPHTQAELFDWMQGRQPGWRILPAGSGSKLHWGGLIEPQHLVLVSTEHLNQIQAHAAADLTITVEAGLPLAHLQAVLDQSQQFWPVNPLYSDQATVGGIIASGCSGSWRHRYGGVRDLVLGITWARADGQRVQAGGRVVKNVAGYDLMKLFTGSYGSLGILTEVTLRLYPCPQHREIWVIRGERSGVEALRQELLSSTLTPVGFDLISANLADSLLGQGRGPGLMLRFHGLPDAVAAQVTRLQSLIQTQSLQVFPLAQTEAEIDQQLDQSLRSVPGVLVKIGVPPSRISWALEQIEERSPTPVVYLQASGVGYWRGAISSDEPGPGLTMTQLLELRSVLQEQGGYLSVLEAPREWKQTLPIWGDRASLEPLQRRLQQQFDPEGCLSPGRMGYPTTP